MGNITSLQGRQHCRGGAEELNLIALEEGGAGIRAGLAQVKVRVARYDKFIISHPFLEAVGAEVTGIAQVIELLSLGEGFNIPLILDGNMFGIRCQRIDRIIDKFRVNRLPLDGKGGLIDHTGLDKDRLAIDLLLPVALVRVVQPVGEHEVL